MSSQGTPGETTTPTIPTFSRLQPASTARIFCCATKLCSNLTVGVIHSDFGRSASSLQIVQMGTISAGESRALEVLLANVGAVWVEAPVSSQKFG